MTVNHRSTRFPSNLFPLAKVREILALLTAFLIAIPTFSQNAPQTTNATTVTIPPGTRIPLVLTHPVQSKHLHRGDNIYAQVTSPVLIGNQVVIPPGTFVQGIVEKLQRKDGRGEMHLQSMSLTMPEGYVAQLAGPIDIESEEGYAQLDPGNGRAAGALIAPLAGAGIGLAIGAAAHTKDTTNFGGQTITTNSPKGLAIGAVTGGVIGTVVSLVLIARSKGFYLDAGSPVEMILQQPLTLEQSRITDAVKQSAQAGVVIQPVTPRPKYPVPPSDTGTCYTPGNPGTPDTDIPGTPATDTSPGTPPIHIAGIPATPPIPHPCP
jgi:hypothetical protein